VAAFFQTWCILVQVHCDHATDDNYGLYTDFYLITTKLTRFPANGLNSILGATRHTRYSSTKIYLTLHTQDSYTFVKYTPSSGALLPATATQWWHGSCTLTLTLDLLHLNQRRRDSTRDSCQQFNVKKLTCHKALHEDTPFTYS